MSFDFIAPHYRWLERTTFQNSLQTARTFFLDQISGPKHVLIAGEGNGRFLREFTVRFPQARVDCVDASERMLELAREQVAGNAPCVRFIRNDLLTWSPEENLYDLIVTHFFLDCLTAKELEMAVAKLARSATENATWLLADFSIPGKGVSRAHAQLWLRAMYLFFRLTTQISGCQLFDPSRHLIENGFRPAARKVTRFGLIKSELWQRESRNGGLQAAAPL